TLNRFDQPHSATILAQERLPAKTGESQRVGVPRLIMTLASLSMVHVLVLKQIDKSKVGAMCLTCPCKAAGMAPDDSGFAAACEPRSNATSNLNGKFWLNKP